MNNACTAATYLVVYAQKVVTEGSVFDGLDRAWNQYKRLIDAASTRAQV